MVRANSGDIVVAVEGHRPSARSCEANADAAGLDVEVVPDACMDILWSAEGGLSVAGPDTTPYRMRHTEATRYVGLRFQPGAAPALLGLAATALAKAPGLDPVPQNWTLDAFAEVVSPHSLRALVSSTVLAGAAALIVTVLGCLLVAAWHRRGAGPASRLLGVSFALPGSTLAVAAPREGRSKPFRR